MSASLMEQLQSLIANGKLTPAASPLAVGSAIELVRLLNSKVCDLSQTLPTIDGEAVTLQEILDSRVENVVRRNGSVGTDYLATHKLAHQPASKMITALKAAPSKGKNSGFAGKGKKAASQPENGLTQELLLAAIQQLLTGQQPSVAAGHTVPATPAKKDFVKLAKGQVVEIDGELMQVSEDGKRLRKTIDENTAVY